MKNRAQSYSLTRPPVFAALCALIGVTILCTLGVWQMQRLAWKTTLLEAMHAEIIKDAAAIDLNARDIPNKISSSFFKRGAMTGVFDTDKTLYFGPYNQDGAFVYHVYTPLVLEDGHAIWVKRGYVEKASEKGSAGDTVQKTLRITGHLKPVLSGGRLQKITGIRNDPDHNKWHFVDVAQMSAAQNLNNTVLDVLFVAENIPTGQGAGLEISDAYIALPNNNHLQYASFWFALAGALIVVFGLRFCVK